MDANIDTLWVVLASVAKDRKQLDGGNVRLRRGIARAGCGGRQHLLPIARPTRRKGVDGIDGVVVVVVVVAAAEALHRLRIQF